MKQTHLGKSVFPYSRDQGFRTPAWQTMMTPKVNIGPDLAEEHLHLISMDATTSVTYLLQQPPFSITERC